MRRHLILGGAFPLLVASLAIARESVPVVVDTAFRTIDGSGNNVANVEWGTVGQPMRRLTRSAYADGVGEPSGAERPNARAISNAVLAQEGSVPSASGATDMLWQWGQFLDHDITETPVLDPAESFSVLVPLGDVDFDPFGTGQVTIPVSRSYYELLDGSRQQVNEITAFVDASNVYGSDEERANALRTLDGTGRLRTVRGRYLPPNDAGLPNAPSDSADYVLAGDFRANEQIALTAMHTLFVREHNYWANRIRKENRAAVRQAARLGGVAKSRARDSRRRRRRPGNVAAPTPGGQLTVLSGDEIYERARAIVGAEMQRITYREFLPALLGEDALPAYRGYRPDVDASISNEFATAAYRVGHTMLPETLRRLNRRGRTIRHGDIDLADAFFAPSLLRTQGGIEPVLRGLCTQVAQEVDAQVTDGIRNFLFGPPGAGGLDLASLNIQRGRDHGLAGYNDVRRDLGLEARADLTAISSDPDVVARLSDVYESIEDVDLWAGGLAEDHVAGGLVGETFRTILIEQFTALRDGDRFWYASHLPADLVELVEQQSLADIIRRNTRIGRELQSDVFHSSD